MFLTLKLVLLFELLYNYTFKKKLKVNFLGFISAFILILQDIIWGVFFSLLSLLSICKVRNSNFMKVFIFITIGLYFNWVQIIKYYNILFDTFILEEPICSNDSWIGFLLLINIFKKDNLVINPRSIFFGERTISVSGNVIQLLAILLCCEMFFVVLSNVFFSLNQTNIVQTWLGVFSFFGIVVAFRKIFENDTDVFSELNNFVFGIIPNIKSLSEAFLFFVLVPIITNLSLNHWFLFILLAFMMRFSLFHKFKIIQKLFFIIVFAPALLSLDFIKFKEALISILNPMGLLNFYNELYLTYAVGMDLLFAPFFLIVFCLFLKVEINWASKFNFIEPIAILFILIGFLI
tara:strand:+ start:1960 stop:3003 length:1044 start_codon:yes stop_codon:yes gene_type:complete